MRRAALDAGYTQAMANNAGLKILPGAREEFKQELARKVHSAKLVQRIVKGLNARETKFAEFEGEYTDQRHLVDFSERRRYAELALKLFGFLKEQVEITGVEQAPVNFSLQVNFVDPDPAKLAREKLLEDLNRELMKTQNRELRSRQIVTGSLK